MDGAAALGGEGGGGFLGRAIGEGESHREREEGRRPEKGKPQAEEGDQGAWPCDSDSLRIAGATATRVLDRLLAPSVVCTPFFPG